MIIYQPQSISPPFSGALIPDFVKSARKARVQASMAERLDDENVFPKDQGIYAAVENANPEGLTTVDHAAQQHNTIYVLWLM